MKAYFKRISQFLSLGIAALLLAGGEPAYAAKPAKAKPTSREYVTAANSMQITTTRKRSTYSSTWKPVVVSEVVKYEVSPLTRVEIDGKVSEAAKLLPGMVVTIVSDRKQSMNPDDKGVLIARMVTATTKAKDKLPDKK